MSYSVSRYQAVAIAVSAHILCSVSVFAQDPVKVAPNNYKVAFENETVRVIEVTAKAGDKVASHSHPDHAVYAVTAGKIKFTYPDGKSKEVEKKAGEAIWIKAETHATENVGTGEFKAVVIELKKPAASGAATIPAEEDQAKVAADSTKVVLDNERVRVMDTHLKPGGKLAKHSHPACIHYSFTTGKLKVTGADGKAEDRELKAGDAKWSDAVTHSVENAGTTEMHGLLIEFKEQAKAAESKPGK